MNYCRNLEFDETPNYAYLRRLFKDLYNKCCFEHDCVFDWTLQKFRVEAAGPILEESKSGLSMEGHVGLASNEGGDLPAVKGAAWAEA